MPTIPLIIIFAAGCLLTSAGLLVFLYLHPRFGLIDIPNERSSHSAPVPRGGGLVVVTVAALLYVGLSSAFGLQPDLVFMSAGLAVAAISFVDDIRSIPLLPRLLLHFAAAAVLVLYSGGYTGLSVPHLLSIDFGRSGPVISVLYIVWCINAYNFMDGIDGVLGGHSLSMSAAWTALGILSGWVAGSLIGAIIAGCCLGFLFFNWEPARIFMGDVGSTFLGYIAAGLPLIAGGEGSVDRSTLFAFSLLFSGLFLFDTVYTRAVLIARGEKFWRPHREHLYQRLTRAGARHGSVAAYFAVSGAGISALGLAGHFHRPTSSTLVILVGILACGTLLVWAGGKKY